MLLTLSAAPESGDTASAVQSQASMPQADWQLILDMYRSIYDEREPKQKTNAAGELLFLDASGNEVTQAQADAAAAAAAAASAPTPPPAPAGAPASPAPTAPTRPPVRASVTPVYRPRTDQEVMFKIASGMTKGAIDVANNRQKELAQRALAAPTAIKVTAVNPAV